MEFVIVELDCKLNGKETLNQASQTRGPREGPMRPANIKKMMPLNEILFLPNVSILISWFKKHFQCGPRVTLSLRPPALNYVYQQMIQFQIAYVQER